MDAAPRRPIRRRSTSGRSSRDLEPRSARRATIARTPGQFILDGLRRPRRRHHATHRRRTDHATADASDEPLRERAQQRRDLARGAARRRAVAQRRPGLDGRATSPRRSPSAAGPGFAASRRIGPSVRCATTSTRSAASMCRAVDGRRRDPDRRWAQLLRSLARNISDARGRDDARQRHRRIRRTARRTTPCATTSSALARLMVVEDQPAWAPHLRSKYLLRERRQAAVRRPLAGRRRTRATPGGAPARPAAASASCSSPSWSAT